MLVDYGTGKTKHGPGVEIYLNGDEIAIAIEAYLVAHTIIFTAPRGWSKKESVGLYW